MPDWKQTKRGAVIKSLKNCSPLMPSMVFLTAEKLKIPIRKNINLIRSEFNKALLLCTALCR